MNWENTINSIQRAERDAFCLVSHASYILKTSGTIWAVDPRLSALHHEQADHRIAHDLEHLSVAMVTHLHADHYDLKLIRSLSQLDTIWLFPSCFPQTEQEMLRQLLPNCIFMNPGDRISVRGLTIQAFESNHYDQFQGRTVGIPEIGYRVDTPKRQLLFPGDVRNFDHFPEFLQGTDELFAHVWLGREAALHPSEEMIAKFSSYFSNAHASRIWLTHLNDLDRLDIDRWTEFHASMIRKELLLLSPDANILVPLLGQINEF